MLQTNAQNVYNGGKDIISRQDLPKYLQKVREATGNDLQTLAEQRQAIDNINRLAKNGAPNKALQAAYNELLEAVQKGNEKAIEKAVEVAVNEKSRYVAERITRTDMARAWADGFIAKMKTDADIVVVKFKLSSRHPVFDICDMYAKADMYGLGAGIYPKDKLPPLPVHPHCLCRYVEVIEGEVDMQQQHDQVREAGDKWLNSLPESRRVQVLGRKGLKAWENGKDWQDCLRGWQGLGEQESRVFELLLQFHADEKQQADKGNGIIKEKLRLGEISKTINADKQNMHIKGSRGYSDGRSQLDGDLAEAQWLADELSTTGEAVFDSNGNWKNKERVVSDKIIGTHADNENGKETRTKVAVIVYSKTGSHIYPRKVE